MQDEKEIILALLDKIDDALEEQVNEPELANENSTERFLKKYGHV